MMHKMLLASLLALGVLAGCGTSTTSETEVTQRPAPLPAPDFNPDSAYAFVAQQVDFGPRVPNTAPHAAAKAWLVDKLTAYGATVQVQEFDAEAYDGTTLRLSNIIGSLYPEQKKRVLLAAHWDTRPVADQDSVRNRQPIAGANDGASGVGVLLEVARALQWADTVPRVGIDIILFDGEDYGEPEGERDNAEGATQVWWCLGSQHWADNKHTPNYAAYYGILLDMVGAQEATFYQEGVLRRVAPSIVKKVWSTAQQLGYGSYFVNKDSPEIIDDHVYVSYEGNIPMIDIIEHDPSNESYFGDYWHTHADDMDIISRETLEAVGETVLHVVYGE